jgi:hypothetical protein
MANAIGSCRQLPLSRLRWFHHDLSRWERAIQDEICNRLKGMDNELASAGINNPRVQAMREGELFAPLVPPVAAKAVSQPFSLLPTGISLGASAPPLVPKSIGVPPDYTLEIPASARIQSKDPNGQPWKAAGRALAPVSKPAGKRHGAGLCTTRDSKNIKASMCVGHV